MKRFWDYHGADTPFNNNSRIGNIFEKILTVWFDDRYCRNVGMYVEFSHLISHLKFKCDLNLAIKWRQFLANIVIANQNF